MVGMLRALALIFADLFKSRARVEAEIVVLRHQLNIALRKRKAPLVLTNLDRSFLIWLFRLFPSILKLMRVVRPATVVRWHRGGFRAYWRWKSGRVGGRPRISKDLRDLIRRMSSENALWGAPRIHGELLKLGFTVAQSTVAKYMAARPICDGEQNWKTFLRNQAEGVASIDLLTVPTIWFEQLYVCVVLTHARREIALLTVARHPTALWLAQQLREAFPWDTAPRILIRDNDAKFGHTFRRRISEMGIRDHPTSFRSPWQNGYAERVIGSIRRECLDHVIVFNEGHLRRVLSAYARYYNTARTHRSLAKDAPVHRPIERFGAIRSHSILGGLHHQYARIE